MPGFGRVDRVFELVDGLSDPELSVSSRIGSEAAAVVDRVIADPTTATAEDWQAARDAYLEAFENEGDR